MDHNTPQDLEAPVPYKGAQNLPEFRGTILTIRLHMGRAHITSQNRTSNPCCRVSLGPLFIVLAFLCWSLLPLLYTLSSILCFATIFWDGVISAPPHPLCHLPSLPKACKSLERINIWYLRSVTCLSIRSFQRESVT